MPDLHQSLLPAAEPLPRVLHTCGTARSVQRRRARQLHDLSCIRVKTAFYSNPGQALMSPCSCWTLRCGPCLSLLSHAKMCRGCEDVSSIEPPRGFPCIPERGGNEEERGQSQDSWLRFTEQPQHWVQQHLNSLSLDFPSCTPRDGENKVPTAQAHPEICI